MTSVPVLSAGSSSNVAFEEPFPGDLPQLRVEAPAPGCELHSGSANEERVRHGAGLPELTVKLLPAALRYVGAPLLREGALEV